MYACGTLAYNYFLLFYFFFHKASDTDSGDTESGNLPWKKQVCAPLKSPEDACAPQRVGKRDRTPSQLRCALSSPADTRLLRLLCLWPPPEPWHVGARMRRGAELCSPMVKPSCVIKVCHTCLCVKACTQVFMAYLRHGAFTPCLTSPPVQSYQSAWLPEALRLSPRCEPAPPSC